MSETGPVPKVLVIAGSHGGQVCGPIVHQRLLISGHADSTLFTDPMALGADDLRGYEAIVYYGENSHQKRDFTDDAEAALRALVHAGTGLVGLHVAGYRAEGRLADLFGGNTNRGIRLPENAPRLGGQWLFRLCVADPHHPVTAGVHDFELMDEHYVSDCAPDVHVLVRGEPGVSDQPFAWVRQVGKGRVFHTPLGHRADSFGESSFWRLIDQGITWVARRHSTTTDDD